MAVLICENQSIIYSPHIHIAWVPRMGVELLIKLYNQGIYPSRKAHRRPDKNNDLRSRYFCLILMAEQISKGYMPWPWGDN